MMYNTFKITPATLTYKTYQDLIFDIKNNLYKFPVNIDLIVGIPRSGMIPAYMLGLMLSKPVCTLNELLNENFISKETVRIKLNTVIRNILIIDDSLNTGSAITKVKENIIKADNLKKYNIFYSAVYYKEENYKKYIDIGLVKVALPRIFQWNYLNHIFLKDAAFDIDGVLCYDPRPEENDDGIKYKHFLLNARPLFIPQYRIPYIITSRLKKYEPETKEWLAKNNIQYDHLIMLTNYTAEQRRKLNLHAKFKAEQYKKLNDIQLFIESERNQAQEISRLSNKLCFCVSTDELFGRKNHA